MSHTLLVVFAHPDDETFGTGGIFAKYHAEGVRTVLACMTDGDAGRTSGQDADTPEALARQRRAELLRASSVLGVDCVEPFAFPDGKLEEVERSELVERTVATIRRHRPDVIVTFGPEGAPTEHRDHKICSRIATEAFERAGDSAAFPDGALSSLRVFAFSMSSLQGFSIVGRTTFLMSTSDVKCAPSPWRSSLSMPPSKSAPKTGG